MKSLFDPKIANKKMLMEIGVYLSAIAIVVFAINKASVDIMNAGKRTTVQTLATDDVKKELAKLAAPDVKLDVYLQTVDLLLRHARTQDAQTLIIKRLKHIRAKESQTTASEEITLLRCLALSNIKMMKFEDAQLIYKEAASIASRIDDKDAQILISSDLIDLYSQYTKFAQSDVQRKGAENLFNKELEHLNGLVASHQPDAKMQRLIHNRHRVGLIEMNRFLELDNFDPEPGRHGAI